MHRWSKFFQGRLKYLLWQHGEEQPVIMRKWRSSSLLPVVLFFLVSAARPQTDILTFVGDVRLPACAYDCVNLYTIQYICSQRGSERKNCFCQDIFSFKQRGWGCDSVCRSTKEIKMVSDFVQTTCNDVFSSLEDSPNSANKTENSTPQSNGVPKDHEGKPTTYSKSKKVANWYDNPTVFPSYPKYVSR
jgi:hypothetical protein